MNHEGQSFESKEAVIDVLIEQLAEREEMNTDDILSDIITFSQLYEEDKEAAPYLEEVAERIGISFEEVIEYAQRLKER